MKPSPKDIVTLVDNDNTQHSFEVLDAVELSNELYFALLPLNEKENQTEANYYIFKTVKNGGEELLEEVYEDELLDSLEKIFESRFDSMEE